MPLKGMDQSMKDFNFLPRPAVESRWKEQKYIPEVAFYDAQYVVGAACSSHDAAMDVAKICANELKDAMLQTGRAHVARYKWKEAKE